MWTQILMLLVRRVLFILFTNTILAHLVGPEVTKLVLGDSFVAQLTAVVGTVLLIGYSIVRRWLERERVETAIAAPPSTTVAQIKAEVSLWRKLQDWLR